MKIVQDQNGRIYYRLSRREHMLFKRGIRVLLTGADSNGVVMNCADEANWRVRGVGLILNKLRGDIPTIDTRSNTR